MSAIQQMHDIEVNGGHAWPEEGKILVYLGCPLDPPPRTRMFGEALVGSFADAEALATGARQKRLWRRFDPPMQGRGPIVQRLFEAGIPGSIHWVYEGAFGVALGNEEGGVTS